ncbi:Unc119b [Thecamonas trahens ATCC 50062]|uniref:Unc119b n=1 Tax=Thecamonas trahens ATCC 50062 TaxID=461836 RepID=A0A0L0DEB3_THETB|nr:Unc119b [Thecamonas trahens ATCC 50062]KNC50501.1 Unc119b [Thecamonas trahens ATCC 50062]|eukprot:XP_013762394.1 Unc119b [Thecamonas trahens ATCC 50062]
MGDYGDWRAITPDEVLGYNEATQGYLCPHSANVYGIEFIEFKIRDLDSGAVLFNMRKPDDLVLPPPVEGDNSGRFVSYDFGAAFLRYKTIGTALTFSVGPEPVPNFRMIERHYFGDKLLKSFDFNFGFCIPNSTNSWEVIYEMPQLTPDEEAAMIAAPYHTKSDSFYFVNGELIMHNKAEYGFSAPDGASED